MGSFLFLVRHYRFNIDAYHLGTKTFHKHEALSAQFCLVTVPVGPGTRYCPHSKMQRLCATRSSGFKFLFMLPLHIKQKKNEHSSNLHSMASERRTPNSCVLCPCQHLKNENITLRFAPQHFPFSVLQKHTCNRTTACW